MMAPTWRRQRVRLGVPVHDHPVMPMLLRLVDVLGGHDRAQPDGRGQHGTRHPEE
jgi:hypothetical protein